MRPAMVIWFTGHVTSSLFKSTVVLLEQLTSRSYDENCVQFALNHGDFKPAGWSKREKWSCIPERAYPFTGVYYGVVIAPVVEYVIDHRKIL